MEKKIDKQNLNYKSINLCRPDADSVTAYLLDFCLGIGVIAVYGFVQFWAFMNFAENLTF